jgi:N-acetylmuramoyl-L-alanine amidase
VISATTLLTTSVLAGVLPLTPTAAVTPTFLVPEGDLVNVRSAPTTRSRAIGRLQGPYDGEILGRSVDGQWLQFALPRNNRVGWVSADVVQVKGYFEEPPQVAQAEAPVQAPSAPAAELPRVLVPSGDVVNVRSGPGTAYDLLGRMRSRQTAFIIGRNGDGSWWQIRFGEQQAWISARFVRTVGSLIYVPTVNSPTVSGQAP